MSGSSELLLEGVDAGPATFWAWEWRDGAEPRGAFSRPMSELAVVLERLADALPGPRAVDLGDVPQGVPPEIHRDLGTEGRVAIAALHRVMTGELVDREASAGLARMLAAMLLPAELVAQIRRERARCGEVDIVVLPAQSCARVPWELLRIGAGADDERLLDLARVVTLAPRLHRPDEASTPQPTGPPLHVVDPRSAESPLRPLFDEAAWERWRERAPSGAVGGVVHRMGLSRSLLAGPSRLTYVGHVAAGDDPAHTGLVLGEGDDVYGVSPARGVRRRDFTAQDAVVGTLRHDGDPDTSGRIPARALVDGQVRRLPGRELWPMPPRVGLVACESGGDFRGVEPLGLVAAMFDLGAELVIATRWSLHTDRAFGAYGAAGRPLLEASLAIDEVLGGDDPVGDLVEWQRGRLRRWRDGGALGDSPLTWAAFTAFRGVRRSERPGEAA
jgi:hypothetical protein